MLCFLIRALYKLIPMPKPKGLDAFLDPRRVVLLASGSEPSPRLEFLIFT